MLLFLQDMVLLYSSTLKNINLSKKGLINRNLWPILIGNERKAQGTIFLQLDSKFAV